MAPVVSLPNLRVDGSSHEPDVRGERAADADVSFQGELARRIESARVGGALPTPMGVPRDVAPTHTPLTGRQAASALSTAWREVTGQAPNPKLLSVLVAQWSHETGRGEAMLNYNFGGIKGSSPSGLSAAYRTHEGSGASARVTTDRFRAYRTAGEGAADYVRFLRARFPAALRAADSGDASGFVHELKRSGYFTDNEESYARSVADLARRAERDGFDSIGAASGHKATPSPSVSSGYGLALANPVVDSRALADELAQAALRIAQQTPEDHLNEIERLDTRTQA